MTQAVARAGDRGGAARKASAKSPTKSAAKSKAQSGTGYFAKTEQPLTILVFLLPLILLYEVGTYFFIADPAHHTEQRIVAFNLMQQFFRWFGATGKYLPPATVIVLMISFHLFRNDPWSVKPLHVLGMVLESALLAIPLIVMGFAASHYLPLAAGVDHRSMLVLSVGAGIYEELIFRLIAFAALHWVLIDVLGVKKIWGGLLIVASTSLLFAAYHYLGEGNTAFWPRVFIFRTLAGAYFGAVFWCRGFGISAGSHSAYDILILSIPRFFHP